jgi:hypothetical protein
VAFGDLRGHWSGAASARARKRADTLCAAALAAGDDLDKTGAALQAHAAEVAESARSLREITTRARSAGLEVVDGEVRLPWGVVGLAHGARDAVREDHRLETQRQVDVLAAQLARRQGRLAHAAEAASLSLSGHSRRLRLART